ncbi:hypothetical protein OESDEN_24630 [Oesophagostomum dentatum]|uniref:Uncharacterized protein n=1 Tax=Oesophagostomum dentatum TaxID=61180 RepID=A0A0B1RSV0_OESDE|nr:hypothetical protein OESDEN_24630 [Oesophagostomum dentatum]
MCFFVKFKSVDSFETGQIRDLDLFDLGVLWTSHFQHSVLPYFIIFNLFLIIPHRNLPPDGSDISMVDKASLPCSFTCISCRVFSGKW